ncbi:MAG: methionine adenosyltransferase [Betaproteobacteria bacterium]|nr:methionine adenosyltransferase [Betaproteobacteria bacterium]
MFFRNGLFTSESVSGGHPDKVCDQISDAILDAFLRLDPHARVACQCFAANGKVLVAGEFRTRDERHFLQIRDSAADIVRQTLRDIGYGTAEYDIDPATCEVEVRFNHQSAQIAASVDRSDAILGAGDQGLMFGYATDETPSLMPLAWSLATELLVTGWSLRDAAGFPLKPDAKSQVTVSYADGRPVGIEAVVISWQHQPGIGIDDVREYLQREILDRVIPPARRTPGFRAWLNPSGAWTIGGPKADTGLTGKKIIVDTYGGACPHGGGSFSGKDPTKVDRSGAYAARFVAKHVVAAGLARRCTVQVSYAIGRAEPVSVAVDLHGSGQVPEEQLVRAIGEVFDLTPGAIIDALKLLRPIYQGTATYGHFGQWRDPEVYLWEATPRVAELRAAVGLAAHASYDIAGRESPFLMT